MTDCPNCKHPLYAHILEGEGQCQYWIIKRQSDWIPDKSMGKKIKAWTMEVEYEGQCPCLGISKLNPSKIVLNHTISEYVTSM